MNRNNYLQSLKDGLCFLDEAYQQQKILEVDAQINLLIQTGKTEEEAILDLGDVQELIRKIYIDNHVNLEKLQTNQKLTHQKFNFSKLKKLFEVFQHTIDVMSKNSAKANGKIIFDLLLLILLTSLFKIPFVVVRQFGVSLLDVFSVPLLITIWYFIVEILYWAFAIFFFLYIFQKWFSTLKIQK